MTVILLLALLDTKPLDEAKEHFAEGRFRAAAEAASMVAERDDDYARARYLMGEISLMLGEPKQAVESLRAARKAKPDSGAILTALGRALVECDENAEAVKVLGEAVKRDPKSGRAHCYLGIALRHDTFGKKGAKELEKGVKLAPDDAIVARAAVLYWLDDGDAGKAKRAADRFAKKSRKHPMAPFLKALVLEREKEYDEAIEAYRKAVALDDLFLDAHKNLAILCIAQNPMYRDKERTDLAMKHLARYRELGGKDPKILQIEATLKKVLPQITGGR